MGKKWLCLVVLFISGCTPLPTAVISPTLSLQTSPIQDFAADRVTETAIPPTILPTQSASLTPDPSPNPGLEQNVELEICSPLQDVALPDLPAHITNPYHPPPAGSDDPHQGIDFASLQPGTDVALAGLPVQAVLEGEVAGLMIGRFPYGNAVMIETPLDLLDFSPDIFPSAIPTLSAIPALTCPAYQEPDTWNGKERSLYLLYAHLQSLPDLTPGNRVRCGQILGTIGDSGNALNPHLHLEMRVGPAGARFSSMSHYDSSASNEEMALYCLWRVSGWFQTIDPMKVLSMP